MKKSKLKDKIKRLEEENRTITKDIYELIERPESKESDQIRFGYGFRRQMNRELAKSIMFGSPTNAKYEVQGYKSITVLRPGLNLSKLPEGYYE